MQLILYVLQYSIRYSVRVFLQREELPSKFLQLILYAKVSACTGRQEEAAPSAPEMDNIMEREREKEGVPISQDLIMPTECIRTSRLNFPFLFQIRRGVRLPWSERVLYDRGPRVRAGGGGRALLHGDHRRRLVRARVHCQVME